MPVERAADAADDRIARAEAMLRAAGLEDARVAAGGHKREVAVVETAPENVARLAELAPELKALGFRYVAVELPAE